MDVFAADWLNLMLRWAHMVVGIGWIGTSFYFIALDYGLRKEKGAAPGIQGAEWQVHGGGFYHVEKFTVAPPQLPEHLVWFRWEAYLTWVSGFGLLVVQYYWNARAYLIDPVALDISPAAASCRPKRDPHERRGMREARCLAGGATMSPLDPEALGRRAEAMLEELAAISAEPDCLVRLFLTPEHRRAAKLVAQWMGETGLEVSEDALGNVRSKIGQGPRLLLGSHIDSVINAGIYDGPLGVVAPILAVDALKRAGAKLPALELLAFGDEEGSRFPSTLSTSAAAAGAFDRKQLELKDSNGVTYAEALRAYGKNPDEISRAAIPRGKAAAWLEVHIEQGPVLESKSEPLGVVTAIAGQTRLMLTLAGEAGHAGTVPMDLRRDALAGAAEITLLAERIAREAGDHMVATVGRMEVRPGAVNIIPAEARFTLDLRSPSDTARKAAIGRFEKEARAVAARRKLTLKIEPIHEIATTPCDAQLQHRLAKAVEAVGAHAIKLPSGAGHDGLMLSKICPIAMLFVRCKGGVSHNPAEYASPADLGLAIAALMRFIENFGARQ